MFNYIPQDAHNVDLNFKDLVTGSADFDFGSSGHVLAQIDVFINASVCAEINVLSYENNQIDAAVSTAVIPEILSVIGQYAQKYYLHQKGNIKLTETVQHYQDYLPDFFPLVHPSPRNQIWMAKNPWFEAEVVPELQALVQKIIHQ